MTAPEQSTDALNSAIVNMSDGKLGALAALVVGHIGARAHIAGNPELEHACAAFVAAMQVLIGTPTGFERVQ